MNNEKYKKYQNKENVLKDKSYAFAIRIVNLYKYLVDEKKEYVISKQVLRSGTSIGAHVREAEFAQSKADFTHKISGGLKEANETAYWLSLLHATEYITDEMFESIDRDCGELIRLSVSSVKTSKNNEKLIMKNEK